MKVAAIYQSHPAVVDFLNGQSRLIVTQLELIASLRQTISVNEAGIQRLGRENIALGAEKEYAELELKAANERIAQLEAQLAACDAERQELRAALGMAKAELAVAKLPASSQDNVIQLVREAA